MHVSYYGSDDMAAETHVDNSIKTPELFLDNNIKSTYNLLEYARNNLPELKTFLKKNGVGWRWKTKIMGRVEMEDQ